MTLTSNQPGTEQASGDRFQFRRIDPATDAPAMAALGRACEAADQVDNIVDEAGFISAWASAHWDAARDNWVVLDPTDPSALIAEGWAVKIPGSARAFVGAAVHPAWRNQGLGRELLRRALDRAREQGNTYVSCGVNDRLAPAHHLLQQFGFRRVVGWMAMRLPAETEVALPRVPAGYTIRPYSELNDPALVLEAHNRGFIGHWENRERPLDEEIHRLQGPHVRPDGIFLATDAAGKVAGFCWTEYNAEHNAEIGENQGHIELLGVVPEARRTGLGRALLLTGVNWLRAQGMGPVELGVVGNNELALPLYQGVGFAVKHQGSEYRLDL
jgi:mycothiol synthase